MRPVRIIAAVFAACLLVSVAQGAGDKRVVASFESLSASGVTGQVTLMSLPKGGTRIHAQIRGLQPDVEYVSRYFQGATCTTAPGVELTRIKANPAGIAQFNVLSDADLELIQSVSVQFATDDALQACAPVNQ